ncbi:MAG: PilZ domain-containing protein [Polyangiaceae bacterium]
MTKQHPKSETPTLVSFSTVPTSGSMRVPLSRTSPSRSGEFLAVRPRALAKAGSANADPYDACEVDLPEPRSRTCDVVLLQGDDGDGVVYLIDGEVAWVASRRVGVEIAGLRTHLLKNDRMSAGEIDLALALARADGVNFCELVLGLGLVEQEVLRGAMRDFMREHFLSLLAMPRLQAAWKRTTTSFTGNLTLALDEILDRDEAQRWRRLVAPKAQARSGSPVRRHEATALPLRRSVEVESVRGALTMTTIDVSDAGARLRSSTVPPMASRVTVHLAIAGQRFSIAGRVVHFERATDRDPPAITVVWTEFASGTAEAFAELLSSLY